MTKKLSPAIRSHQILDAALAQARLHGYSRFTRDQVAAAAEVSTGLVSRYYSTMVTLRRAVMRAAIKQEVLPIVAQGLAMGDKHALAAPDSLKKRASASLVG